MRSPLRTLAKSAPLRSLHGSRKVLSEVAEEAQTAVQTAAQQAQKYTLGTAYRTMKRTNLHVLDAPTLKSWQEIPKGGYYKGDVWKIWYNHAIVPLFVPIIAASTLMLGFLYRYFSSNVEIAWSKEMRQTYDHTGLNEHRAEEHSKRLLFRGMMERNKSPVTMFPFNFEPLHSIRDRHIVPYNGDGEARQQQPHIMRISVWQWTLACFGLARFAREDPDALEGKFTPGKGQY